MPILSTAGYKTITGIADAGLDTALAEYIEIATDVIDQYLQRKTVKATYTSLVLSGNGKAFFRDLDFPIAAAPTLTVSGSSWTENTEYEIDNDREVLRALNGNVFPRDDRNITITYDGGWDATEDVKTEYDYMPYDLRLAASQVIDRLLSRRNRSQVKSMGKSQHNVTYADGDLLNDLQRLLNLHKHTLGNRWQDESVLLSNTQATNKGFLERSWVFTAS